MRFAVLMLKAHALAADSRCSPIATQRPLRAYVACASESFHVSTVTPRCNTSYVVYIMPTIPDVFIIESLDPDDEGNGRFEGGILSSILRLHGKEPKYRYVRTRDQFQSAVKQFAISNYRYLHISAHADEEGMCTTNQDPIDFDELGELLRPHLRGRRLFLSACSMTHEELAREVIPKSGCYSVVGPTRDIAFTDAAVVWSAIYHLMFSRSSHAMKHAELKKQLLRVTELFNAPLAYYSRSTKLKRGYTKDLLST